MFQVSSLVRYPVWRHAFVAVLSGLLLSACTSSNSLTVAPYAIPNSKYAAVVIEVPTGKILHASRADAPRYPASLTKMMTIYLLMEQMKSGKITKNTPITISDKASREPASKLYLKPGDTITVHKAIEAMTVKSANDVAYAVAEFLSGSEAAFASRMTQKARQLGMSSTIFRNASGLPDKRQISTARDMARLGIALRKKFPEYYHYFGMRTFTFKGKKIRGHNRVLGKLKGADGIKTGYTRASGFNLATSVRYNGKHLVAVIMGEDSGRIRDTHMVQLLEKYGAKAKKQ